MEVAATSSQSVAVHAFWISAGFVALAEIGDKTQLLALLLAARFQRPLPVIAGITVATLANHGLAGLAGAWVTQLLGPSLLRWLLGLGFIAMGGWALVPDKADGEPVGRAGLGAISTTLLAFFLVEMGDKTQVATAMLAARYTPLAAVILGTTSGMLLADVPAVLLGERVTRVLPLSLVRRFAAALFVLLGIATLLGGGSMLGL
jgi:putative Ca2+/H+ antiporter (TMEM165/GDT1 family)